MRALECTSATMFQRPKSSHGPLVCSLACPYPPFVVSSVAGDGQRPVRRRTAGRKRRRASYVRLYRSWSDGNSKKSTIVAFTYVVWETNRKTTNFEEIHVTLHIMGLWIPRQWGTSRWADTTSRDFGDRTEINNDTTSKTWETLDTEINPSTQLHHRSYPSLRSTS